MLRTLSTTAISPSTSAQSFFDHERTSTSLTDLDIVRKIVEREGCLEALTQLLATHARATQKNSSMSAMATLTAAPMVLHSLLNQLRGVSVQVVESIDTWKQRHGSHHVFQWRSLNYQLKMLRDLDFLVLHTASIAQLDAFQGLRLERNPLLSVLHLDHAALKEATPEMACRLALFAGNVDMRRIFWASKALLLEEAQVQQQQELTASLQEQRARRSGDGEMTPTLTPTTTSMRLHWSHRPMTLALSPSMSSPIVRQQNDPRDAMAYDVELTKELLFQHEHELGAMKEELAVLQKKLQGDLLMAPDKKRQLQNRVATVNHEMKLRTGDLFHRRNELQRKEAVLRMDKRRFERASEYTRMLKQQQQRPPSPSPSLSPPSPSCSSPPEPAEAEPPHFSATATFKAALQADELRRHELVNKFATHSKLKASMGVTKRHLLSLARNSPEYSSSARQQRPSSGGLSATASSGGAQLNQTTVPAMATAIESSAVDAMTCADVEAFINTLQIGDDPHHYGSVLRAQGIDGKLLAQANESDLEELGITIRLHRVKIIQTIASHHQASALQ